jgi:hypothetical protein
LTCPLFCFAQNDFNDSLRNKIGFGGMYFDSYDYALMGSYSRILKRENEIALTLYYNDHSSTKEITLGGAFNNSVFKKLTKFDFLFAAELNFNLYWWDYSYNGNTFSRYGPFFYLGIIPSYNFSKRFSLSMEYKIGGGYGWSKNFEYIYEGKVYNYHDYGWYWKGLGGFKLNYKF